MIKYFTYDTGRKTYLVHMICLLEVVRAFLFVVLIHIFFIKIEPPRGTTAACTSRQHHHLSPASGGWDRWGDGLYGMVWAGRIDGWMDGKLRAAAAQFFETSVFGEGGRFTHFQYDTHLSWPKQHICTSTRTTAV